MAANGSLASKVFPNAEPTAKIAAYALGLTFPVPLHVISIGLILQRRWLSSGWSKFAWIAIVTSGLWLGAALVVKMAMRL